MSRDKRKAKRKPISLALPVWIEPGDGSSFIECKVEDASDGGLRLPDPTASVPKKFFVHFSPRDLIGKPGVLRWRRQAVIGVEYSANGLGDSLRSQTREDLRVWPTSRRLSNTHRAPTRCEC
jgi:PilZ domain